MPAAVPRLLRTQTQTAYTPQTRPALTVSRGETVVVETQDCLGGRITGNPETHHLLDSIDETPITGPLYVDGAEIGDVLCVHILHIALPSSGIAFIRPHMGILGKDIRRPLIRSVAIQKDRITLDDDVILPVHPVIGNIGVASRHGKISSEYPGRHGGNMDTLDITSGARVFLPVQVKGALLSLGDVKACMGDGQTSGSGVEVPAEVTIRVDTLPGGRFSWPRIKSKDNWVTVASASTVEQASRLAVIEMIKWLEQEKGMSFEMAYLLVGLSGELKISQWSNPLITARIVLSKNVAKNLPTRVAAPGRTIYYAPAPEVEEWDLEEAAAQEAAAVEQHALVAEPAITDDQTETDTETEGLTGETQGERPAGQKRSRWRRRRRSGAARREQKNEENKTESAEGQESSNQPSEGVPTEQAEPTPSRPVEQQAEQDGVQVTESGDSEAGVSSEPKKRAPRRWTRRRRSGSARSRTEDPANPENPAETQERDTEQHDQEES